MNLTPHFTLEEMTRSDYAARHGIDNTPSQDVIENLTTVALALEEVRTLLGHPIFVSSGYRGPKVNSAVGGSKTSAHIEGLAADFTCFTYGTPRDVCRAIMGSTIQYDQLIHEFGQWVHIGLGPRMRRQNLTIDRDGTREGIA